MKLIKSCAVQKLLELYKYESARSPEHFSDPVYNANAHVLLHEDACFRFEAQPQDGGFTVQLLEPDRSEVAPGECGLPCGAFPACMDGSTLVWPVSAWKARSRRPSCQL